VSEEHIVSILRDGHANQETSSLPPVSAGLLHGLLFYPENGNNMFL
jgi:hypothetical protein